MDHNSRYSKLGTGQYEFADGREITYRRRRFLPGGDTLSTLRHVIIVGGDRLDLVTAATLGDPEQFWRICDANDVLRADVLEIVGCRVRIPIPKG